MAQSVERPTSAQVMISWFMTLSPTSGSVLTAQSLEPASDSVSPSLPDPPPLMLYLSLSKINIKKIKKNKVYLFSRSWVLEVISNHWATITLLGTLFLKSSTLGGLGGSVGWASNFGSGYDLTVRGFEPRVGLCADSSEPGACFGFCASFSLCSSPAHALSLFLTQK